MSPEKLFVILIIGTLVIGPSRLPEYATKLTNVIYELRRMASGAQEELRRELGPGYDDLDWRRMDPRQYDPRRIIRDALIEEITFPDPPSPKASPSPPYLAQQTKRDPD